MKFISGVFGGKKENGDFFLELKEKPDEPMPKAKSEPVLASDNGAKSTTKTQVDAKAKSANTVEASNGNSKVESASSNEAKEVKAKSGKTAKSPRAKALAAKKKAEKEPVKEISPVVSQASATVSKTEEDTNGNTFAPKYLIPKNDNMRRRPGANMNSFLEMARKAKTPMR